MIIKELSRKGTRLEYGKLLEYMFRESEELRHPKKGHMMLITHNMMGDTIREWTQEFEQHFQKSATPHGRRVWGYHQIMSWKAEDTPQLNIQKLQDLTRTFLSSRNRQTQAIAVAHFGTSHTHVHILSHGIRLDGRANRLSKAEFTQMIHGINTYQHQQYPELQSLIEPRQTDIPRKTSGEYWIHKNGRATYKEEIIDLLRQAKEICLSKDDLTRFLREHGLELYERGTKSHGIILKETGMKFRFTSLGFSDFVQTIEHREEKFSELEKLREHPMSCPHPEHDIAPSADMDTDNEVEIER